MAGCPQNAWSCWPSCGDEPCPATSFGSAPPWHIWCHHSRWWRSICLLTWAISGRASHTFRCSFRSAQPVAAHPAFHPEWPVWHPPYQCRACWSEVVPMRTWKTHLCSRKDTWCHRLPLSTRCSPPGRTVAVTPGQTRWSAIGGRGSSQSYAVCNLPWQPGVFRWPY